MREYLNVGFAEENATIGYEYIAEFIAIE